MTVKNCLLRAAAALTLLLSAYCALANEAQIRKVLEPNLPGPIEGVQPGPIPGLWEVRFRDGRGVHVIYTDATAAHVFDGRVIDTRTGRDLTRARMEKLNAVPFASLPLDLAVKVQRGNGKRVMAMFSDPYCPACRQFEKALQQVDDVTVYVFMYPVIRPENADHSRAVWCAPDRAKAWLELAAAPRPKVPPAAPNCDDPVDKVLKLGRSLAVNSTPTLIFSNGERVSGGLSSQDLRAMLSQPGR